MILFFKEHNKHHYVNQLNIAISCVTFKLYKGTLHANSILQANEMRPISHIVVLNLFLACCFLSLMFTMSSARHHSHPPSHHVHKPLHEHRHPPTPSHHHGHRPPSPPPRLDAPPNAFKQMCLSTNVEKDLVYEGLRT
ncbi:hypothetical protein LIER_19264 [Lithospermum erythrorhizon]|uniref:Uncharacterized protein n=1 Tax=Lithospermum erythrorhizon TaxID=34254 RepID=A0AAV3QJD8_LITER